MKGQITIDLILAIGIAMLIFTVILNSAYSRNRQANEIMQTLDAKHTAQKLAGMINDIHIIGDGAEGNVTLPLTLSGGKTYVLTIYQRSVLVTFYNGERKDYSWKILTDTVNGSENGLEMSPGELNIKNVNGTIFISYPALTCNYYCVFLGYTYGTCRQNPAQCTNNGETYESGGDAYCTGGPSADTCCCLI